MAPVTCNEAGRCIGAGNGTNDVCTAHCCYAPDAVVIERNKREQERRQTRGCTDRCLHRCHTNHSDSKETPPLGREGQGGAT